MLFCGAEKEKQWVNTVSSDVIYDSECGTHIFVSLLSRVRYPDEK